jgi:hypothetical protein
MPLPPVQNMIEILQPTVLPAAGGAVLVMALALLPGRRQAALGSALAVLFGFAWANFSLDGGLDRDSGAIQWSKTYRLIPWKSDADVPSGWRRLPEAAFMLVVVGLVSRWLGLLAGGRLPDRRWWIANVLVWLPRVVAVAVVSGWLVAEQASIDSPWLRMEILVAILISWIALDGVARSREGPEAAYDLAMLAFAAAGVLLYSHSSKFMEIMLTLGFASFGVALAASLKRADVSGAVPFGAAFIPGLVLGGRGVLSSEAPAGSYWLVAFGPVLLLPFLLPRLARANCRIALAVRMALVIAPAAAAIAAAASFEQLPFDSE